ncbi:hypothetical protein NW754_000032 [Fusarium falciforme]|nr:hypothetical protein NW754_000032 [Fusarium falciforme]
MNEVLPRSRLSNAKFLIFLIDKRPPTETSPIFRETLNLAASFKWRNESVWYFLRHMAAWGSTNADLDEFELVEEDTVGECTRGWV